MYTQAIAGCETDASLFSNRSAAYLALGRLEEALWDAQNCVLLSNMTWAKGFYRLGNAHMAMGKCALAADAFRKGAELAPDSEEMVRPPRNPQLMMNAYPFRFPFLEYRTNPALEFLAMAFCGSNFRLRC